MVCLLLHLDASFFPYSVEFQQIEKHFCNFIKSQTCYERQCLFHSCFVLIPKEKESLILAVNVPHVHTSDMYQFTHFEHFLVT